LEGLHDEVVDGIELVWFEGHLLELSPTCLLARHKAPREFLALLALLALFNFVPSDRIVAAIILGLEVLGLELVAREPSASMLLTNVVVIVLRH
jgi:hypothetical protein